MLNGPGTVAMGCVDRTGSSISREVHVTLYVLKAYKEAAVV